MTIDPTEFRLVMGHFATGVALITSMLEGEPAGMSVNSLTSVSLDPPLVLFCADLRSDTLRGVRESGVFAVNVLAEGEEAQSRRFALKGPQKFTGIAARTGTTGAPVLDAALAWLECRVEAVHPGGDHVIVVGLVQEAGARDGRPLVFYRGEYRALDE